MNQTTLPMFAPDAGEILRHADTWWRDCATRAIVYLARVGHDFSAEDIYDLGVPKPDNSARTGSLFSAIQREGLITLVGYRASREKSRNGSVVRVWRGTAKAREEKAA